MYEVAKHCVERYGAEAVSTWYWECWNEPNISYFRGTPSASVDRTGSVAEYCALYDHTVEGLTRALPAIRVGGPAVTGGDRALPFMEAFLAHCAGEGEHAANAVTGGRGARLDFISFHTKGSGFGRRTGPLSDDGAVFDWGGAAGAQGAPAGNEPSSRGRVETPRQSPSRKKMLTEIRAHLLAAARYPQFRRLPVIVDECDPCVPAHFSRYDNPNFGFRNTSYYPTIMASVFKRLMDLNEALPDAPDVALATLWAFYFEGERFFEGFREFFTAENVELPLLNGYRLLGRLGRTRLALTSDATWDVRRVDELPGPGDAAGTLADAEVDGLAARDEGSGTISIALWHHVDDQYAGASPAAVTVTVRHLPFEARRARVRHWRIDQTHSNAYTSWQAMGRPQDPTPEQLAELKRCQGLEEGNPISIEAAADDTLVMHVSLPLHAVSLLEVTADG